MYRVKTRRLRLWVHVVLVTTVMLAGAWGCSPEFTAPPPSATHGVLDLSSYDFQKNGPVNLAGEWEFYWDKLLTPEDFSGVKPDQKRTGYFRMPGTWKGYIKDGTPLGGQGKATFRLRLLPGSDAKRYVLRVFNLPMAYRLWANNILIASSGVPGKNITEELPNRSIILADLHSNGQPIELLLQISNHSFRTGGVLDEIMLALPGTLEGIQVRVWGAGFFFAGCLLMIGGYHVALFFWRRKTLSNLHFGLYCLLLLGYLSTSNSTGWIVQYFDYDIAPQFVERFSIGCYALAGLFLYRFFESLFPREFSRLLRHFSDARSIIFVVIALFFPMHVVYRSVVFAFILTVLFLGYYLAMLAVATYRGRVGAGLLLTGSTLLAVATTHDILIHAGIIDSSYLIQWGLFLFVSFQALTLGLYFSKAFTSVEHLSQALEQNNQILLEEMAERSRLEREVVKISDEERRRISHELHDGLCQKLTSARLWCSSLQKDNDSPNDPATLLTELLHESVDDAYDISRGLWPVDHDPSVSGPSLEYLAQNVARQHGISIQFHQELCCDKCVNPHATHLYRIAQEALANAAKHAQATSIEIRLHCDKKERLTVTIQDNGVGRPKEDSPDNRPDSRPESRPASDPDINRAGGLGLAIMKHRATIIGADLQIGDAPGGGTIVSCSVPRAENCNETNSIQEEVHDTQK